MRQIDFQAHWDSTNSHLKPEGCGLTRCLLSPLHALCRFLIMPAAQIPAQLAARVDQLWKNRWELRQVSEHAAGPDALLLRLHYEPVVLNLTTPDGVPLQATWYRHRAGSHRDTPTILCAQPNAQLSRDEGWEVLLKKGCTGPQPFHVITFDYRSCGPSKGTLAGLRDVELDAETVYQAATENLQIPERSLHFLGYSMGGSVVAKLAANHPSSGQCVSLKSFDHLERVITDSPAIGQSVPPLLRSIAGSLRRIVARIVTWVGWGMDVREALAKIQHRTLFVYHPQDALIPPGAAAVNAAALTPLQAASQVVRLQFKPTVRCECPGFKHHGAPMQLYQDVRGLNATKRICNFILGRDLFAQRRPLQNRRHVTIDPSGIIHRL